MARYWTGSYLRNGDGTMHLQLRKGMRYRIRQLFGKDVDGDAWEYLGTVAREHVFRNGLTGQCINVSDADYRQIKVEPV